MRDTFLPFALPSIGEEEIAEVADSLRSGWITTGPKTKRFEEQFQEYVGAKHAIAVNSCTAGLHIALTALGIGQGDEVIVPTLTFCSTANVVVHLGAHPVLVDIGEDFNVTPEAIEEAITPKTRAIMPLSITAASPATWKPSTPSPPAATSPSWKTPPTPSARHITATKSAPML